MMLRKWLVIGLIVIAALLGFFQVRRNAATLAQIGIGIGMGFGSGYYNYGGGPFFGVGFGSGGYGGYYPYSFGYPYSYGYPYAFGGYNSLYYPSHYHNAVYTGAGIGVPVNFPRRNRHPMQPYYYDGQNVWSTEDLYRNGSFRQVNPTTPTNPNSFPTPRQY